MASLTGSKKARSAWNAQHVPSITDHRCSRQGIERGRLVFENLRKAIAILLPAGTLSEWWAVRHHSPVTSL